MKLKQNSCALAKVKSTSGKGQAPNAGKPRIGSSVPASSVRADASIVLPELGLPAAKSSHATRLAEIMAQKMALRLGEETEARIEAEVEAEIEQMQADRAFGSPAGRLIAAVAAAREKLALVKRDGLPRPGLMEFQRKPLSRRKARALRHQQEHQA